MSFRRFDEDDFDEFEWRADEHDYDDVDWDADVIDWDVEEAEHKDHNALGLLVDCYAYA